MVNGPDSLCFFQRYLIVFLAQVVENSEKTKMTSQNMSICFGVSLLSNNSALNGVSAGYNGNNSSIVLSPPSSTVSNSINNAGSSINETAMPTGKTIDMNMATNVFDFILNNYKELFMSGGQAVTPTAATSAVYSNGGSTQATVNQRPSNMNNSTVSLNLINSRQNAIEHSNPGFHLRDNHSDSPHSNRYSVMIIDNSTSSGGSELATGVYPKAGFMNNGHSQSQHSPPTSLSSSTSTSTLTTSRN